MSLAVRIALGSLLALGAAWPVSSWAGSMIIMSQLSRPRYLTVTYQIGVQDRLFSGKIQGTDEAWVLTENQPLQQLGVPLPGPTGCVAATAHLPVLLAPKVDAQLRFMPARDGGQRVVVEHQQVWEARLTVEVMTGYAEQFEGGCRRFWPDIHTSEARVRLFEDNPRTYALTVPNVPGWNTLSASIRISVEPQIKGARWLVPPDFLP